MLSLISYHLSFIVYIGLFQFVTGSTAIASGSRMGNLHVCAQCMSEMRKHSIIDNEQ